MTRFIPLKVRNPLMIAITSAMYGYTLEQERLSSNASSDECDVSIIKSKPDELYFRFGGCALADMFNICYNDMKYCMGTSAPKKIVGISSS